MSNLLPYDWTLCTVLAVLLGGWNGWPWKMRLTVSLMIGLAGWAASFPLMILGTRFGYDTALAEEYLNGADIRNSVIGILVISGWMLLWSGVGMAIGSVWRRVAGRDTPPSPRG